MTPHQSTAIGTRSPGTSGACSARSASAGRAGRSTDSRCWSSPVSCAATKRPSRSAVGWSLGGVFGREYARYHPERIKALITLGSPFSGDPRQNNVWQLYEKVAKHPVDDPPLPRITDKPPVPHLAIWSRRDGLIAPRAARGLEHERDKEVELDCHHMAFGISPAATKHVVFEVKTFLNELA